MLFSLYVGSVLERFDSYTPLFVLAGIAYFIALALIHILSPTLRTAQVRSNNQ
jgi:ACS family hexuronate transporter-like MFS transporter